MLARGEGRQADEGAKMKSLMWQRQDGELGWVARGGTEKAPTGKGLSSAAQKQCFQLTATNSKITNHHHHHHHHHHHRWRQRSQLTHRVPEALSGPRVLPGHAQADEQPQRHALVPPRHRGRHVPLRDGDVKLHKGSRGGGGGGGGLLSDEGGSGSNGCGVFVVRR